MPNTNPPWRFTQIAKSGGQIHGAHRRSRVARRIPTNSNEKRWGRISRNQWEVAAASQTATVAPRMEPLTRKATHAARPKTAKRTTKFRQATASGCNA
jgi:hypothetical protein